MLLYKGRCSTSLYMYHVHLKALILLDDVECLLTRYNANFEFVFLAMYPFFRMESHMA